MTTSGDHTFRASMPARSDSTPLLPAAWNQPPGDIWRHRVGSSARPTDPIGFELGNADGTLTNLNRHSSVALATSDCESRPEGHAYRLTNQPGSAGESWNSSSQPIFFFSVIPRDLQQIHNRFGQHYRCVQRPGLLVFSAFNSGIDSSSLVNRLTAAGTIAPLRPPIRLTHSSPVSPGRGMACLRRPRLRPKLDMQRRPARSSTRPQHRLTRPALSTAASAAIERSAHRCPPLRQWPTPSLPVEMIHFRRDTIARWRSRTTGHRQ